MKVIVIGSGIGGLTSAIDLAASGHQVTVLEMHDAPGGRMRERTVSGIGIDSGPTVFTMRWVFDELFALAGTSLDQQLSLRRASELARHVWTDGSTLDLFADLEDSVQAIQEFAGETEGHAYRSFAMRSERVFETLDDAFMRNEKPSMFSLPFRIGLRNISRLVETRPWMTLWQQLGRDFADPRLRQLFARYATYCGSSPLRAPATLMLIAHAEREGVWIVDGGMQRFAEAMSALAGRLGAELRYSCRASELLVTDRRVTGVVLASGERLHADAVVFNGDVNALSAGLLGADARCAVPDRQRETRSLSAVTLSLVVKRCDYSLKYHTVFFGNNYPEEFAAIFERQDFCDQPTVYVCAQDRVEGNTLGETERLFLLMNAPARELTESETIASRELLLRALAKHGLVLDIVDEVITTPNAFAERFPGTDGAIYGWPTHGMHGSFERSGSRSAMQGLYFAGGSVHPGPGIPMVALSGRIAARAIRKDLG